MAEVVTINKRKMALVFDFGQKKEMAEFFFFTFFTLNKIMNLNFNIEKKGKWGDPGN